MKYWLFVLLALAGIRVTAQATPPTATTLPLETDARLLFPQQLLLSLVIPLPATEVQRTTLTLSIPDAPLQTIRFPADQPYDFAREYVVAAYTYAFPSQPTVPLFSVIRYRWQVETVTGESAVVTGKISYEDTRVPWRTVSDSKDRITFVVAPNSTLNADSLANSLDSLLDQLQANTGKSETLRFLVYPPDLPPSCPQNDEQQPVYQYVWRNVRQETPCNELFAEQVFRDSGYQVVQTSNPAEFSAELQRGLVQRAYASLSPVMGVPAWFTEAVIQLYLPRTTDALSLVQQQLRVGKPFTLAQMMERPEANSVAWQAQADSMLSYLMATAGVEPVLQLARTLSASTPFAEAYQNVFNAPLSTLLPNWASWVYTEAALRASTYSIYAATTPTPLPTLTPSPTRVIPTLVRPTTAPPMTATPRPTRTLQPPTATVTPLSAQSFIVRDTATPTPRSVGMAPITLNTSQTLVLMVGGVLIVSLLLIAFFTGRRQ